MIKNVRAYTAIAMLASGVGLSVAGFIAPPFGEISDSVLWLRLLVASLLSVLWFFAQCLMYAGTALGIDVMVDYKLRQNLK